MRAGDSGGPGTLARASPSPRASAMVQLLRLSRLPGLLRGRLPWSNSIPRALHHAAPTGAGSAASDAGGAGGRGGGPLVPPEPPCAAAASVGMRDAAGLGPTLNGTAGGAPCGRKKRVLILMSDTGGGHRASAQALEDAFHMLFPGRVECDIVDVWTDHSAWPYNKVVPVYRSLQKHPNLWRAFWAYGKRSLAPIAKQLFTALKPSATPPGVDTGEAAHGSV